MIRRLRILWLRRCLQWAAEEMEQYAGLPIVGTRYLTNNFEHQRDLRGRIAILECGIDPDEYQRNEIAEHSSRQIPDNY